MVSFLYLTRNPDPPQQHRQVAAAKFDVIEKLTKETGTSVVRQLLGGLVDLFIQKSECGSHRQRNCDDKGPYKPCSHGPRSM